jgi:hypothetical protein
MGSESFLKAQVGKQAVFGTAVTPTIQAPVTGDYKDGQEHHEAPYDSGRLTPTVIVAQVYKHATLATKGTSFFEMLPVYLSSMYDSVTPSGTYTCTYLWSVTGHGTPLPCTWLVGAVGENLGGTGPAVKVKDCYCDKLTLTGNINSRVVQAEGSWFGNSIDDNAGAGYAFAAVNELATLEPMNTLLGALKIKDAATTGGSFATMTSFATALLDWKLVIDPGIRPLNTSDGNAITFGGIRYEPPSVEFSGQIRTSATNYALVRAKYDARTFQELQLLISGSASRAATFNMTGRFTDVPTVHERGSTKEIVMPFTFKAQTPYTQITTPHWFAALINSTNNWV